jgi:hypothetical protein
LEASFIFSFYTLKAKSRSSTETVIYSGVQKFEIGNFLIALYSVADPGSGAFLTPGSGMGTKSRLLSGLRDEHPGSIFWSAQKQFFRLKIFKKFKN